MSEDTIDQIKIVDEITKTLAKRYASYASNVREITLDVFRRYGNPKPSMVNAYFVDQLEKALVNYIQSYLVQALFSDMANHYVCYGIPPESYIDGFVPPEAKTTEEKES